MQIIFDWNDEGKIDTVKRLFTVILRVWLVGAAACAAAAGPAHGLWVWKSAVVLKAPHGAERLRDFCQAQDINEVYVSFSDQEERLARLIALLHRAHIAVEALLSSTNADEPGAHRKELLDQVRGVVRFNQNHPADHFDGIHLDIEPQQRPENKGVGNLRFLPGLVEAYRDARKLAEQAQLTVNADIQLKVLRGPVAERRKLMVAVPRVTLMLYEVGSGDDTSAKKRETLRAASKKFLDMAYEGLGGQNLAQMTIALRTPDYGESLPQMLRLLDESNRANPHYRGWARHSYNDYLGKAR